jgi:uncharacterized protein YbjT (DUF2867 family)
MADPFGFKGSGSDGLIRIDPKPLRPFEKPRSVGHPEIQTQRLRHPPVFVRLTEDTHGGTPKIEEAIMKIVVIGGSGLIGSKLVTKLREQGHEAIAASPKSGVNSITGEGLAEALKGASVVVDVTNSPSWEDAAVMTFFETSTRNLLAYGAAAGVKHHVALSVVGTERLLASGFFRAKMAQENLIKASSIPYTITRATQFFEFVKGIADFSTEGNKVRLPTALIQPMAADDVASAVGRIATGSPVNGTVEVGGPEKFCLDELVRRGLAARNDPREVVADPHARYYGVELSERILVPGDDARLGETRFETWLTQSSAKAAAVTH